MILLFLIMRCTPTIRELIEATPLSLASLDRLPASRLLLPRSGLERSGFVHWHEADQPCGSDDVRCSGSTGSRVRKPSGPPLTHNGHFRVITARRSFVKC
jgi:hypothetical protein